MGQSHLPRYERLGSGRAFPRTLWSIKRGGSSSTSGTDQQAISFHPRANRAPWGPYSYKPLSTCTERWGCVCVRVRDRRQGLQKKSPYCNNAGRHLHVHIPQFFLLPFPVLAPPSLRFHATGSLWPPLLHLDKRLTEQVLCSPFLLC